MFSTVGYILLFLCVVFCIGSAIYAVTEKLHQVVVDEHGTIVDINSQRDNAPNAALSAEELDTAPQKNVKQAISAQEPDAQDSVETPNNGDV